MRIEDLFLCWPELGLCIGECHDGDFDPENRTGPLRGGGGCSGARPGCMLREMKVGNLSCPALLITTLAAAWGCGDNLVPLPDGDLQVALVPAFRADDVPGCALA
jgi:hypothetical protein